jgi:hypothetical protein
MNTCEDLSVSLVHWYLKISLMEELENMGNILVTTEFSSYLSELSDVVDDVLNGVITDPAAVNYFILDYNEDLMVDTTSGAYVDSSDSDDST